MILQRNFRQYLKLSPHGLILFVLPAGGGLNERDPSAKQQSAWMADQQPTTLFAAVGKIKIRTPELPLHDHS